MHVQFTVRNSQKLLINKLLLIYHIVDVIIIYYIKLAVNDFINVEVDQS